MIYLELFWSFFQIGLFSIGGGYAAMPLIQHQVVETHAWLTMTQFADIITIAEMTPGPIAVNSATFVGIHIAGIPGALVATAGCVLDVYKRQAVDEVKRPPHQARTLGQMPGGDEAEHRLDGHAQKAAEEKHPE